MKVDLLNISGKKAGKQVDLPDSIFKIEPNDHAIYMAVKQYMAHQRQGTHSAKEKSTLSGSTKKLHKQKGTGGSRKGSIKSPLFRGGARIFGPRPRTYSLKLNKKVKTLAMNSALSYKAKEAGVIVLEDIKFDKPKTQEYSKILNNLNVADKKTLVILDKTDKNVSLSSRNLQKTKLATAGTLNTYSILDAQCLILTESALKAMTNKDSDKVEGDTKKDAVTKKTTVKKAAPKKK